MQPRHRVSRTAIEMIKRFEGYRRNAAQLPDGRWTIGHGHTLTARQGAEVSPDDAEALLLYDLIGVSHALNEAVFAPLTQNQFDALTSFVFNIGLDSFHQSGVLKRLNEGALIQAACAIELWRKANVGGERIVIDALVRRRSAEKTLFLTPEGGAWVPAPSPILKPLLDTDAQDIVPLQTPVEVTTVLEGDQLVVQREDEPAPPPVAPDEEVELNDPAMAAAEAVTARLSTIFQEQEPELKAEPEPEPEPEPEAAPPPAEEIPDEAPAEPPQLPDEAQAQADFAPPLSAEPFEDPVPFFLRAQEPDTETAADEPEPAQDAEADGPEAGDLFGADQLSDGAQEETREAEAAYDEAGPDLDDDAMAGDRFFDDHRRPFEFAPVVQPPPERVEGNILTLAALAVLGLIFFGGGIFWATYARPVEGVQIFGPRVVGGLAGIAGVAFFVVAVYLLLDRLGRAAERQGRFRM